MMRLEYEATHLVRLHSSAMAHLAYVGREDGELVLVYDHISGAPLRECLERRRLDVNEALVVGRTLFTALRDMHKHCLLHRCIRPSNIIVNDDEPVTRATLVDFDPISSQRLEESTPGSQALDCALYLSPEQAGALDQDVTEASDLYSAGVTLFHCLAGRPPFSGKGLGSILLAHMTASVPKLRSLGITVPRALDEVIGRLLRKDPRDRYQSAEGVLADLDEIAAGLAQGEAEPAVVIGARDYRETLTEPAFVARREEVGALDEQLVLASRGEAELIVLEGESGSGKTRLLAEMTSRAASQGFWVLWGQGTNDAARQPYSLFQGVVDGFLSRAEPDPEFVETVKRRLGDHAPAVGAALPGLADVFGPAEVYASAPEEAGEVRTLHALASFLNALGTADRPVFLVLDDCQWADELTYRLIRRWQGQSGGPAALRHVLLLAALRSEEFDQNHPLRQLRSSVHLRLSPFEPDEIRRLVESMAGPLPGEVSEAIIRLAEGSPFMASAVLRGLVESGSLARDSAGWRMESQEIYDVQSSSQAAAFLTRRLTLLPEDTLRLLANGAVLGREFELNIAAELTGQSPEQSIAALDVARQRRLVWMRPDGSHCVFVHDKIRSALLESQARSERRRLHSQAAKYLEQHAPTRAAEIAYHFDAAGDSRSALPYALQAAEQARAQHALEIAERQYLIAERGAAEAGAAVRYRVLQELGQVLLLRGRYDAAGQKFQAAAVLVEGPFAQAQIREKLGELAFKRGDMEHSIECVEGALRILGRRIPHSGAMVHLLVVWEALVQAMHTWLT